MVISAQMLVPAPIWEGKPFLGCCGAVLQRGILRVDVLQGIARVSTRREPRLEELKVSQTSVQHLHVRRLLQGFLMAAGAQQVGKILVLDTVLSWEPWELPVASQVRRPHRGK